MYTIIPMKIKIIYTWKAFKYIGSTIDRRGGASKDVVEMKRSDWSDLRQESFNKNEAPDIPDSSDSDSTDVALRLRDMANVSQRWKVYGNNRDENGAMGNGSEPIRTPEKLGDLRGSKGGTDSDGHEKEKVGMGREVKRRD